MRFFLGRLKGVDSSARAAPPCPETMPTLPFDPQTVVLLTGMLYVAMPLTVWSLLLGREEPLTLALWCVGGLLVGLGFVFVGLRGIVADLLSYSLANQLLYGSYVLRYAALQRLQKQPVPWWPLLALQAGCGLGYALMADLGETWRVGYTHLVLCLGSTVLALDAGRLSAQRQLRSARMLADSYTLLAGTEALRALAIVFGWAQAQPWVTSIDTIMTFVAALLVALYGNLGYLGMALERAQVRERSRLNELEVSRTQGEQAVQESAELRELLAEREEMLRLLAHEVRQPLHNASAALQSADAALAATAGADPGASERIARGQQVISQVNATLDNTLAAAALLASAGRIACRDTDIETLLQMSIGDLDPTARHRVQVQRLSPTRTAAMDAGLMRLAVRNLLANALVHSPADTPVLLRVSDSDDPLALVIEVCDEGSGITADLQQRLFQRGARGPHSQTGHGLGLYIVRRVMEMHGGQVDQRDNQPRGTIFRMLLPQGLAP
jgi:signal transduction histidine kinase